MKMSWGRKKSEPSSSTTAASIIGRVFPVSWINKFKKRCGNLETNSVKEKQRGKLDFPTPDSSLPPCWREGRFYSMDEDDAYWRLSFTGEKMIEGRRSTGGLINPLWYDSGDESQLPVPSFKSLQFRDKEVPRCEERWNFNDMVLDIKKMKEKEQKKGNGGNDQRLKKPSQGGLRVKDVELGKRSDEQKNIFEIEQNMVQMEEQFSESAVSNPRKQCNVSFPDKSLSSIEEDCASERVSISEWQNLEDIKIKQIKMKNESQMKSACISRESHSRKSKQNNKVKVCSPRTECKIRALEDMKKSRMRMKKKVPKKQVVEGGTMFDRFAVLKSSFNPQQDFRDSMVEMIKEKEIRQTEELEELLACYLTFNCDEYHDLIIKVFRQVWFELNRSIC